MAPKVKFGLRLNIQGEMGATSSAFDYTLEMARMAEDLGFDSIWIPDHMENAHLDRSGPVLEFWTAMTALGALTKRVIPRLVDKDPCDGTSRPAGQTQSAARCTRIGQGPQRTRRAAKPHRRPVSPGRSLRCAPLVVRAPRREARLTSGQGKPVT